MSSLFDLNDRIFAAMDELDAADPDSIEQAIEKAKVKTQLFATAINNANTMARIASMQEQTMDGLALKVGTSRILLGQPQIVAEVNQPVLPEFDAIAWVKSNAHGHTVSWIRDRLNKASGERYTFDEVRAILDEAHVEPVELDGRSNIERGESDSYGLHGPARGYVR